MSKTLLNGLSSVYVLKTLGDARRWLKTICSVFCRFRHGHAVRSAQEDFPDGEHPLKSVPNYEQSRAGRAAPRGLSYPNSEIFRARAALSQTIGFPLLRLS